MKKILFVLLGLIVATTAILNAGEVSDDVREALEEAKAEIEEAKVEISIATGDHFFEDDATIGTKMETPYMGIYDSDITLTKARNLNYKEFYGVVITGIGSNSPAKLYRLVEDDIIMKVDEEIIWNKKSLSKIIKSHYVGDKVTLTIFRNGKEIEVPFQFGSRHKKVVSKDGKAEIVTPKPRKKRRNVGHGGGGWIPLAFQPEDMDDINDVISQAGFREFSDDFFLMHGLGGAGNVGKGLFVGGMGVWKSEDKKVDVKDDNGDLLATRRMLFSVGFGGVTVDKRFGLTKNWVFSIGSMIGWGGYELQISETDADYDWNNINDDLSAPNKNYMIMKKDFIFLQPRVTTLIRINEWLGIRAQAGYNASYSFYDGWRNELVEEDFEIKNSPDTSFNGYTISVGPWFGF